MSELNRWHLIPYFEASGAVQMALDVWLLEQQVQGKQPPTLRFYGWEPAAISLGYHQKRWPEAWATLRWQGQPLDLVQRPSGGRAVLHQGDLTYSLVTSGLRGNSGFTGSRAAVYRQVCEFLVMGWRSLRSPLSYGSAGRGYIHNPNCFGTATGADLVLANGAKLIGSAQLWRSRVLLQQGSMRLNPDPVLLAAFGETGPLPDLPEYLLGPEGRERVMAALLAAAQTCWGVTFERRELSEADWAEVLQRPCSGLEAEDRPV